MVDLPEDKSCSNSEGEATHEIDIHVDSEVQGEKQNGNGVMIGHPTEENGVVRARSTCSIVSTTLSEKPLISADDN